MGGVYNCPEHRYPYLRNILGNLCQLVIVLLINIATFKYLIDASKSAFFVNCYKKKQIPLLVSQTPHTETVIDKVM